MGYLHSVFLILSGLVYVLLFFDLNAFSGNGIQAARISLILIASALLVGIVLHRKPKVQARFLRIIQMVVVVFSAFYYYLLWTTGVFDQWFGSGGIFQEFAISGFAPILGYLFLSLSVRVLVRNLKTLARVDRLRG